MFNQVSKIINRVSIKFQVFSITILSLAGIAAISFGAYYSSNLVSNVMDQTLVANKKASSLGEIHQHGLEMRRWEKDYLGQPSDASLNQYTKSFKLASGTYDQLFLVTVDDVKKQKLENIFSGYQSLSNQFSEIVKLRKKLGIDLTQGYLGALTSSVKSIDKTIFDMKEKMFDPSQLDSIEKSILSLRLLEKNFMLTGDATDLSNFDKDLLSVRKVIDESYLNGGQKAELTKALDLYVSSFQIWGTEKDNFNHEVSKLNIIYNKIASETELLIEIYQNVRISANEQRTETQQLSNMILIIAFVIIAIIIFSISFLIATNITQKIKQLNSRMKSLADGETDSDIPNSELANELGDMAKSLIVFKNNTIARVQAEIEKEELLGDELRKVTYVANLIDSFQTNSTSSINKVQEASNNLEALAKNLNDSATNMQSQSKLVTINVEDTSTNVTSAAGATEEMVASISEISHQASLSTDIADEARNKTKETVLVISDLSTSAKHIEAVIKLIEEIAEQTNLLALNATIEAARAGDAGKGFAVVANEVKSLASQTAKATEEIAERVGAIQSDSLKANQAIIDVEVIIGKLSDSSLGVAAAVEEQSAVINDIASNVTNASSLSSKSSESMVGVGHSIDETKTVSTNVYGLANDLNGQISSLQSEIFKFLKGVKSA